MGSETPAEGNYVLAVISLVLGAVSLCAWLLPICGFPVAIIGLIFGVLGRGSTYPHIAAAGFILCGLGLIASIANVAFGAYLGVTAQLYR